VTFVADTSAFVAVLFREADADRYRTALIEAQRVLLSAATTLELHLAIATRSGAAGVLLLNELLDQPQFEIVAADAQQLRLARNAFDRYGKGRHPAALNFGNLFSYALAKSTDLPLLYKGQDFAQTDVTPALEPEPARG
jgi:ribonuclease VapC